MDNYTFLDKIIYHGKILYYKDISLIGVSDKDKIGYSKKKIDWAIENEYFVWTYFIENSILFDPDNKLNNRFINNAPFSKFYLENDKDSSEMIGKFIGSMDTPFPFNMMFLLIKSKLVSGLFLMIWTSTKVTANIKNGSSLESQMNLSYPPSKKITQ